MDYLDAWNVGFEEGKALQIKLINQHCKTDFKTLIDVILFINEVSLNNAKETENA